MALSKLNKSLIVDDLETLFQASKMTVLVNYQGLNVAQMQALRRQVLASQSTIRVVKNRLVKKALSLNPNFANTPTDQLTGMIVYIFNDQDELAGAQSINNFINQTKLDLPLVGAIGADGQFIDQATIIKLAKLPSRQQLLANLLTRLKTPLANLQDQLNNPLFGVISSLKS